MSGLLPLALVACGALVLRALVSRRATPGVADWPLAIACAPAVTFGALSLGYFYWRLAGLSNDSFQITAIATAAILVLAATIALRADAGRIPSTAEGRPAREPWAWALAMGSGGLALVAFELYFRKLPVGTFDAWAIWSSRARILFRGDDLATIFPLLRGAHPDYPLLLPATLASQFALIGREAARIPAATGALFTLATAIAIGFGTTRIGGSKRWALLAAALFLVTPKALFWGSAHCADIPLAYLLVLAAVGLGCQLENEPSARFPPLLAGFVLGLLAWTKNEGLVLTVVLLATFVCGSLLLRRRGLRMLLSILLGAAPSWLALLLFRWRWAPSTDLGHFVDNVASRLVELDRWRTVGGAFAEQWRPDLGLATWGLLWPLLAVALGIGWWRLRFEAQAFDFVRCLTVLCWLAWFAVFLGTPLPLEWHLRTALDRLMLQLVPISLIAAFVGLSRLGEARSAAGRRARAGKTAAVIAAMLLVQACGGSGDTERSSVARWIEHQPGEALPRTEFLREARSSAWTFELATEPNRGWVASDTAQWQVQQQVNGDGLDLRAPAGARISLRRDVEVLASAIDRFTLAGEFPANASARLLWAAAGESFSPQRQVEARAPAGTDRNVHFAVGEHPEWSGEIGRLRIDYHAPRGAARPARLTGLSAGRTWRRRDLDPNLVDRAWRLELDHELRDGFVATPQRGLTWPTPAGAGRRLEVGFGIEGPLEATVRFAISAHDTSEPLFEAFVGPESLAAQRWHDARVDLPSGVVGDELRFEVEYSSASPSPEPLGGLAYWSAPTLVSRDGGSRGGRTSGSPDILLVSVDTLRPDRLSLYGYDRNTSPRLDRWAGDAMVFENAVTSAPWTLPAHLSLMSGRDALSHGVNHRTQVPTDIPLLAETLRAAGYTTVAITGGGYLDPEFGLARGFDSYRYWPEHTAEPELAAGVAAAAARSERVGERPLFLFFHTYEPHHPYRPRQPYFERFSQGRAEPPENSFGYVSRPRSADSGFVLAKTWQDRRQEEEAALAPEQLALLADLYDSSVAFADEKLGELLEVWDRHRGPTASVVAITSDHGEALGEKGLAGHAYLEDFNSLIPLVVRLPRGAGAGRYSKQVRITDVAPTLLEAAGLATPAGSDGLSLYEFARGHGDHRPAWIYAAFSNRGAALRLNDRWKYTFDNTAWMPRFGHQELFDLRRDHDELSPVAPEPDRTAALRAQMLARLEQVALAVKVTIDNPGTQPLRGFISGRAIQSDRLKGVALPDSGLRSAGPRRLALTVPAGERSVLMLENPGAGQLRLSFEPGLDETLDLFGLDEPWVMQLGDGGWQPGAVEGHVATLAVAWTDGAATSAIDPSDENPELRRQLEALGYIE